ncbi:MAG TPA: Uma2 family endonuclease [Gemmataceae bacterium]|nr:Uma2 family endonuclease [Gemmataceae bacterium]
MVVQRPRFRWSVDEYEKMIRHGILTENHNVELIRGEVVPKMSIGDLHAACLNRIVELFFDLVGKAATRTVQNPIRLADSEPEPDFALLVRHDDFYASGKPRPADVYLVVEVADASLVYDREVKGPLYAENGIAEYWIVNLVDRCLEVHRRPRADGKFEDVRTLRPGESISLVQLPTVSVLVSDIIA